MTRPLNILTLATLFPNAAMPNFGIFVERQTAELASRQDVALTVINPIGIPPQPLRRLAPYAELAKLPAREQWRGLDVYRPQFRLIPKIGGPRNPERILDAILPVAAALHEANPFDLIDAEFFYPDGPAAMLLAEALDLPFTIKARGADIHFWGNQSKCRPQMLAAAEKASRLLAVSGALKQDMVALGMSSDKIDVHYTGLDQKKFKPVDRRKAKQKIGVDGPLLISVGALIARKNQDLVIGALPKLPGATLILAGSGKSETQYRKLAKKLGVDDRVRFAGNVPHDELPELIAAADVSVLVSTSEGLANAWVESLACGTPVVISEAGGARELVTSGNAGRIVKPSTEAIASAVGALLEDPPEAEAVRAHVSRFSWQNNADQLQALFSDIAGQV